MPGPLWILTPLSELSRVRWKAITTFDPGGASNSASRSQVTGALLEEEPLPILYIYSSIQTYFVATRTAIHDQNPFAKRNARLNAATKPRSKWSLGILPLLETSDLVWRARYRSVGISTPKEGTTVKHAK
jgi:hypothetical protein